MDASGAVLLELDEDAVREAGRVLVECRGLASLAVCFLLGGRLGPLVVRKAPAGPLRVLIACAGLGLSVHLRLDAYH